MKCPYCNEEMMSGYIQCRDGVYWSDKKRMVAAIPPIRGNAVDLRTISDGSYKSYTVAYNCPKCKKIVIDYAEKQAINSENCDVIGLILNLKNK